MSGVGWTSRFERVTLYPPIPLDQKRVLFPLDRFEAAVCGPKGPDPYWEARFPAPRAGDTDVLFAPSHTRLIAYRTGGGAQRQLTWDGSGTLRGVVGDPDETIIDQ